MKTMPWSAIVREVRRELVPEPDRSTVFVFDGGEDLDEVDLPAPLLAQQGVDLAVTDVHVDAGERRGNADLSGSPRTSRREVRPRQVRLLGATCTSVSTVSPASRGRRRPTS